MKKVDPVRLWLVNRFMELELQVSTRGQFASIVDNKLFLMSDNHVKCLLRKDYIEANGNVPGLNRAIERLLADGKASAATIPLTGEEPMFLKAEKLPT